MKALALLSGGLDSSLAIKLILDQGIEVVALNFTSPFCLCNSKGCGEAARVAEQLRVPLIAKAKGKEYLKIIRNPKHGYGKNMNPCIDCRIFILKEAKKIARQIGAKFIFTGEVLGQRPKSQHYQALRIIEKEAGLEGKLLRPLSAKLLPETEAERRGWVNRSRLLGIRGRQRKIQIELAKKYDFKEWACPAGGCLLTQKEFADKLKDLFQHKKRVSLKDINLLKMGRHFRFGGDKIIVGRNKEENKRLLGLKGKGDYFFEAPKVGSPITLLQGKGKEAIKIAASLTARYSDSEEEFVLVNYGKEKLNKEIKVKRLTEEEIRDLRL